MAKITIDFLQNKKVTVNGQEKELKEVAYTDETGKQIEATIWRFDKDNVEFPGWAEIAPGSTIDANPWVAPSTGKITLYAPKTERTKPTTYQRGGGGRTAAIDQAMDKKASQIAKAQDRSALMWAKYGACEIVAHHPAYKNLDMTQVEDTIEHLTTWIYNGELTQPFNS